MDRDRPAGRCLRSAGRIWAGTSKRGESGSQGHGSSHGCDASGGRPDTIGLRQHAEPVPGVQQFRHSRGFSKPEPIAVANAQPEPDAHAEPEPIADAQPQSVALA
jgi:hypothetical protein